MKDLNQLENHLRSWTPRQPSPAIKRRVFPSVPLVESELPDPINWSWLAPAMAVCIMALIVLARSAGSGTGDSRGGRLVPTFALSNLDFSAFYAAPRLDAIAVDPKMLSELERSTFYAAAPQNDHNVVTTTFEWTNGAHSSTTAPSVFERTDY